MTYPDNTPGFTGLMNGHVLSDKEMDFTALKLSVPYSQTSTFNIKLSASYAADGATVEDNFEVTVPVATYQADQAVAQVTGSLGSIAAGDSGWFEVDFTGLAPTVEGFELVVSDPAGLTVYYPAAKSSTSLFFNDVLEDNETDFAAFLVDTTGVAPGTYVLGLGISYTMGGSAEALSSTVTVDVTG